MRHQKEEQKLLNNPKDKEFALANPKKLGYLITLEADKIEKAIRVLNHHTLGDLIKLQPEEISFLTRVSEDPEKLLNAVLAIETTSNHQFVNSSSDSFFKSIKDSKSFVEKIKEKDEERGVKQSKSYER